MGLKIITYLFSFTLLFVLDNVTAYNRLQELVEKNKLNPMQTANFTFKTQVTKRVQGTYSSSKYILNEEFLNATFEQNDYTLKVFNTKLKDFPDSYYHEVDPNLLMRNIRLKVSWSQFYIHSSCKLLKVNSSEEEEDKIKIRVSKIIMVGSVGLKVSKNLMKTSDNFNLYLNFNNFKIRSSYDEEKISPFENSINTLMKRNLRYNIQKLIEKQLDEKLKDFPLDEVFNHNNEAIETYKASNNDWTSMMNSVVDSSLSMVIKNMVYKNTTYTKLEDMSQAFKVSFFLVEYWGQINLRNTTVGNFSTLTRTAGTALFGDVFTSDVNLVTSLGFQTIELKADDFSFDLWGYLGASGKLVAVSSDITAELSLNVSISVMSARATITDAKLLISRMGAISVYIKGPMLLNIPISFLTSIVANMFQQSVVDMIQERINEMIETSVINKTTSFFS